MYSVDNTDRKPNNFALPYSKMNIKSSASRETSSSTVMALLQLQDRWFVNEIIIKILKIGTHRIIITSGIVLLFSAVMVINMSVDRMANTVYPNQTAPSI